MGRPPASSPSTLWVWLCFALLLGNATSSTDGSRPLADCQSNCTVDGHLCTSYTHWNNSSGQVECGHTPMTVNNANVTDCRRCTKHARRLLLAARTMPTDAHDPRMLKTKIRTHIKRSIPKSTYKRKKAKPVVIPDHFYECSPDVIIIGAARSHTSSTREYVSTTPTYVTTVICT